MRGLMPYNARTGHPSRWTIFDSILDDLSRITAHPVLDTMPLRMDLRETVDAYIAEVEVSGCTKQDISVTVKDDVVEIRAERKDENDDKTENFIRLERSSSVMMRRFVLPEDADTDRIDATCKDGVLTLNIPKTPLPESTRRIDIK